MLGIILLSVPAVEAQQGRTAGYRRLSPTDFQAQVEPRLIQMDAFNPSPVGQAAESVAAIAP